MIVWGRSVQKKMCSNSWQKYQIIKKVPRMCHLPPCNQKNQHRSEISHGGSSTENMWLSQHIDRLKWILKLPENLNHVRSSSNFQDIFLIIYWHDSWFQRWPHYPSLQSGTLNVLQVPNETSQLTHDGSSSNFQDIFLIIHQHHLWCQRWPHPSSLQSGNINNIQALVW